VGPLSAAPGERLQLDPRALQERDVYFLMTSVVVPRPIGWISTLGANGVFNVAPHSYFNVFSDDPPMVAFSSGGLKDTVRNVRHTWDFVANVVSEELAQAMNVTATEMPPEESEFRWAGLTAAPSVRVRAPRVAEARVALECRVVHLLELGRQPSYLVIGEVVLFHVDPTLMRDGRVDPALLRPVGRLSGSGYSRTANGLFEIRRLQWPDVRHRQPPLTS
jgi:flavin reductase (DIM6/NTAB) family NADH-FMN oxidoreductase RutF